MKVRFDKIGYPLYCDAGSCAGDIRIDLALSPYLSPEEYARYEGSKSLRITLSDRENEPLPVGNTAEPSGELSVGDVALAVGRPAGWVPVSGGLNQARTSEHGTRPLPGSAPCGPGEIPAGLPGKEPNGHDCP
jgi:hypothetical protein